MAYWLVKTEPESFGYEDLVRLGRDRWNGVRNMAALKHLKTMRPGDKVFIYHTGKEKAIVGVAEVASDPYPDPEFNDTRYPVVDLTPRYRLPQTVSLKTVKADPAFADWVLTRQPRLSVMPVSAEHWWLVHQLAGKEKNF